MQIYDIATAYNYRVLHDSYYLFYNLLPSGPVEMLQSKGRIRVAYMDYDGKIITCFRPYDSGKMRITYISALGKDEYWQLMHVISAFNLINEDIHVYCSGELQQLISRYCMV